MPVQEFFQKTGFENCRIDSNHTHREAREAIEAIEDNVIKKAGVAAKGGVAKVKEAVRNSLVKEAVRQLSNNQLFMQKVRGDR